MKIDPLEKIVIFIIFLIIALFCLALIAQSGSPLIKATLNDPTAFFTMILAIFTVLIWSDARKDFAEQRIALIAQSKSTEEALRISSVSAQAAKEAVESSKQKAQVELRAYISASVVNLDLTVDNIHCPRLTTDITLINGGKTPAKNTIVSFHWRMLDWPLMTEDIIPWPDVPATMEKRLIVPPNEKVKTTGAHEIDFDLEQVEENRKILCLIMIIEYFDIFGDRHETRVTGGLRQTLQFLRDRKPSQVHLEGGSFGNIAT